MRYRYGTWLIGCLLTLAGAACKKDGIQETVNYTFTNSTAERLQLDIYGSEHDYHANQNPIERRSIEAGGQVTVPLQTLTTVWADWYNADYTLHNWAKTFGLNTNFEPYPLPKITVAAADDRYLISRPAKDSSRSVMLNGGSTSSRWKAVVDGEPILNGTYDFLFRKDFTGELVYTDLTGNSTTDSIRFRIFSEDRSTTSFSVAVSKATSDQHIATLWFRKDIYPYYSLSRDRLIGFFGSNTYEVLRQ